MAVPRNAQCPKRGVGLSHAAEAWVCAHCDQVTYDPDDPIGKLRATFIEAFRGNPPEEETPKETDFAALTEAQWHRAIYERRRYERGELTDWPDGIDSEEARAVAERMADSLLSLFRKVE